MKGRQGVLALVAAIPLLFLAPGLMGASHGPAVPWLQAGGDAARTGATDDAGPATFDEAFSVRLPGARVYRAPPLVLDGAVFVLTGEVEGDTRWNTSALWRVDLATAEAAKLVALEDDAATSLASDGSRLFLARGTGVSAFALDGAPLWTAQYPRYLDRAEAVHACAELAVRDGMLFAACSQFGLGGAPTIPQELGGGRPGVMEGVVFVLALDAATGREEWSWVRRGGGGPAGSSPMEAALGFSVVGRHAFVVANDYARGPQNDDASGPAASYYHVWALDAATGRAAWDRAPPVDAGRFLDGSSNPDRAEARAGVLQAFPIVPATPTGTRAVVFLKWERALEAVNPADGAVLWSLALQARGETVGGSALALARGDVLVTSYGTLYRIDPATRQVVWSLALPADQDWFEMYDMVATPDVLVAHAALPGGTDRRVLVLDLDDGRLLWTRTLGNELVGQDYPLRLAVGDGLLVAALRDGTVSVLGSTPAAIHVRAAASLAYPLPGEVVTLDGSDTLPGALSSQLEYRVEWGDDSASEWQDGPLFSHVYREPGTRVATLFARNDEGQTARTQVTFHVGGVPPEKQTFIQAAFAPQRQESTFFVLGLLVTAVGAALGLARYRRRRAFLRAELDAVERAYARTRSKPRDCESVLRERRTRAHALFLDGKLDDGQYAVLKGRVDELAGAVRMSALDERFEDLPHGLVKTLESMLEDGRVSSWERRKFVEILGRDRLLSARQKTAVRDLVEEWFRADADSAQSDVRRRAATRGRGASA